MIGGQSGNQSRSGSGLAASSLEYQPEVVQPKIAVAQPRIAGKFRRSFSGITKDSAGAPLGGCVVDLFLTATDVKVNGGAVSDANGVYELSAYADGPYYVVAYKAGAPDVAGTTVNTLNGE